MMKNLITGPILARLTPNFFSWVLPVRDTMHFRKLSWYAISRKMHGPNSRKRRKTFWTWFRSFWPEFWLPFFSFFFKNLASSGTRYHGQLSSFKISEKTYYPILRNLVTDGRTDRQTDESDFLGRWPTDFNRSIDKFSFTPLSIVKDLLDEIMVRLLKMTLRNEFC